MRHAFRTEPDYYAERAAGLLASAMDGTPGALELFTRHELALSQENARTALALDHGLSTWDALAEHITQLDDDPFARAYRALEAHDADALRALLDAHPELAHQDGTNGNDLLGLAGTDEQLVRLLLDRGADVQHANVHGWTALHSAAYSGSVPLARLLIDAGARLDVSGRGDGGTPLVVALFWGHREVAELLAARDLAPGNLRVAAGLGRVDLLDAPAAPRGFYRPHSGFPHWQPSEDRQEALDEALSWAARNGRTEALEALTERGADLDADVYRGTALTWAAFTGQTAAIRTLVRLGADVNKRSTFGGPGHGQGVTALHLAAQDDHVDAVEALVAAGGDLTAEDELFHSTPLGWAEFCDAAGTRAVLTRHAPRSS